MFALRLQAVHIVTCVLAAVSSRLSVEFLQPCHAVTADARLENGTVVISGVMSPDEHLS